MKSEEDDQWNKRIVEKQYNLSVPLYKTTFLSPNQIGNELNCIGLDVVRLSDGTLELHKTEAYDDDVSKEMTLFLQSYLKGRSEQWE